MFTNKCSEKNPSPVHTNNPQNNLGSAKKKSLGSKSYNSLMDAEKTATNKVGGKRNRKGDAKSGKAVKNDAKSGGGGVESEHETHILTERERRKKMRNMFSSLHALLPQLPSKADKSTIVDESVKYIKTLEENLQALEKQRLEKFHGAATIVDREPSTNSSSQTQTALESREAFLAAQGPSKNYPMATSNNMPQSFPVPLSSACFQTWLSPNVVMNMCGDDAHISVCSQRKPGLLTTILYILEKHHLEVVTAHFSSDQCRVIYMIHAHARRAADQYLEALSVEDTFKLAAGEINLWLLSC